MRSKILATALAVSANATATSTAILLVGSSGAGIAEAVPGEDMGFPSSGTAVVALTLENVTLGTSDTINVLTSNNYYADAGSGETFSVVKTYTPGAIVTLSKTVFLDQVPLGEAVQINIISGHTSGAGKVSAYLLSN